MRSTPAAQSSFTGRPVALFWDQSLVWGLICVQTLREMGVPFDPLGAQDIAQGRLGAYRVLVVPGGWAAHKLRALGETGADSIRNFVREGGSYIGFCGGAGLALSDSRALGLVPVERMGLSDRLPSASGEVTIRGSTDHPAWKGLPSEVPVSVWWPSQFHWQPMPRVLCLASYRAAGKDFRVADLAVSDMQSTNLKWPEWEKVYAINLNPARLLGHPAILEARTGKGRLVLSYPHLETPGDTWGNRLFLNLLDYLDRKAAPHFPKGPRHDRLATYGKPAGPGSQALACIHRMAETVQSLMEFGERNLLWSWRRPWLLAWKRGIRGLEYSMLAVMIRTLRDAAEAAGASSVEWRGDPWLDSAGRMEEKVDTFCRLAVRLLLEEKLASEAGRLTKLGRVNREVDELRGRLFGSNMNHGGICRSLFDDFDSLLLRLISGH
jgi:hypothetical protein